MDVAPAILHGLRAHQRCSLESMQTFLLKALTPGLSERQLLSKLQVAMENAHEISVRADVATRLNALKHAIANGTESRMYQRYIKLVNDVLAQCRQIQLPDLGGRSDLDMICVCNDPEVIFGTDADQITYREPDLVYINWRGIRRNDKQAPSWEDARRWAEESFRDKISLQLDWSQVLMVNELKNIHLSKDEVHDLRKYTPDQGKPVPYADPKGLVAYEAHDVPQLATWTGTGAVMSVQDATVPTGSKRKSTWWNSVDSTGTKIAKAYDENRPLPIVQMGIYASKMLSVKGMNRAHALGMLTQNDWTWIWYFDSAGAIQTQGFNIFAHTADFVVILMLLQFFKLPQWGFPEGANSQAQLAVVRGLPSQRAETHAPQEPAAGTGLSTTFEVNGTGEGYVSKTMVVHPASIVHRTSSVLTGRRTTVYDAEDPAAPGVPYVAKWSYPEAIRENEANTVWIARDIARADERAFRVLPHVAAFKDFANLSTDIIRAHLHPFDDSAESLVDPANHANRILRCIFEEKLEPLSYLTGLWVVRGMNDCIYCRCLR
ncbi:hypothetical protein DAEQUDRAFT_147319 [Daedalea quercina L-15889]|uniref:Fungal-type protein kinase domain-containing protein n=1 Tax=Daedalea quercina L-15889 TaxID=1314783 RepID=A0A165KND8_9APHY|nr:hypothetical protein DAEQUDRAFT_147319 [Daedalea quercina L-15889]